MESKLKTLQAAIAEAMEHPKGTTRMTRARRILNVMHDHMEEIAIQSFIHGRESDEFNTLDGLLKEKGLLPNSCNLNLRFEKILDRYEDP